MTDTISRIMFAGTHSGCGKTTITCAVLRVFQKRGLAVASFKCGPDYIDPMFHSKVIGAKSRNIDFFLCGEEMSKYLFAKNSIGCDLSVSEGVMGFYDGIGGNTAVNSSWDISEKLDIPVVLIVDCKGASLSVAATIKGYLDFRRNNIAGVILNNVSAMMYPTYKKFIEQELSIKVLGHMPKDPSAALESRHLGLVTADEIEDINAKLDRLAEIAEKYIDLDGIFALAGGADALEYKDMSVEKLCEVRLAYASDRAFCFYYEDSLSLLRQLGAELVPFSPLHDNELPENIDGIILGGGYPELYAEQLSQNTLMLSSIKKESDNGTPIYAECGGFMYLMDSIDGKKMCGVINASCQMTPKLQNFGYITLTSQRDNLMLSGGEQMNAHEFHYSSCDIEQFDLSAKKQSGKQWQAGFCRDNLFALYPHLHLCGNIAAAKRFILKCNEQRTRSGRK